MNITIQEKYSGVIYIEKDREVVFNKSYGYANTCYDILNQIDTKFPTASSGKVFVATAILQLIEQGKLSFNTTISDVFSFDLKEIDPTITVQQLLNHTSGIPDYFDESIMNDYSELFKEKPNYNFRKSTDLIPLFINKPMMYQPGEKFQYNNTGYVMLGMMIESITRKSFDQYIKDTIFIPSQMYDTGYFELDRLPKNCANAYIYDNNTNSYYTNIYSVEAKGSGAGGAFTTVIDIKKFWNSLLSGKLLSKDMLQQMLSIQARDGNSSYGYGVWFAKDVSTNEYFPMFMGSDPGVSFITSYHATKDLLCILVSNFEDDVWELHRKIQGMF